MPDAQSISNIIRILHADARQGGALLVEHAKSFAHNRKLYFETVIHLSKYNTTVSTETRLVIRNKLIELAETMEQEERAGNILTTSNRELEEKRNYYIQKGCPNELMIECLHVRKKYSHRFELNDINLQIRRGEITGVVGENGNGKTTILRILAGRLKIDGGLIKYNEKYVDPNSIDSLKSTIAFLPQELDKVYGNVLTGIRFSASIHGIRGTQNDFEVEYIINRLNLTEYQNANWSELSGGFKVRFALAKILVRRPKVLILDEPLANLDINTQNKLLSDLRDIAHNTKYPVSIVFSSQQIEEVESIADNMLLISKGRVQYEGRTAAIGNCRSHNCFEVKTALSLKDLMNLFNEENGCHVVSTGISYLVNTPLEFTPTRIFDYLKEKKVELSYFNDLSNSTKKMIYPSSNR